MKLATVFGASFSSSFTTILPCDVSKTAYVPDGRLMHSPRLLNHPTRATAARATRPAPPDPSPALLFPQFRDVCGMVFSVPFVEKKKPIYVAFAVLRMHQAAREMLRPQRPPQTIPSRMHGIEKSLR